jgi:hypothetical protein
MVSIPAKLDFDVPPPISNAEELAGDPEMADRSDITVGDLVSMAPPDAFLPVLIVWHGVPDIPGDD